MNKLLNLSLIFCRYAELVAKHGKLDPLAIVNMEPANSVAMTVVCGDKEALFDIPTKQTIGILQCMLKFCSCKGNPRFVLIICFQWV